MAGRTSHTGAFSVETTTGRARQLLSVGPLPFTPSVQFAGDLWGRPLADRPPPPDVRDPRLVALAGCSGVLALLALVVGVRTRRRRGVA
jgi:hypothetical protein